MDLVNKGIKSKKRAIKMHNIYPWGKYKNWVKEKAENGVKGLKIAPH